MSSKKMENPKSKSSSMISDRAALRILAYVAMCLCFFKMLVHDDKTAAIGFFLMIHALVASSR